MTEQITVSLRNAFGCKFQRTQRRKQMRVCLFRHVIKVQRQVSAEPHKRPEDVTLCSLSLGVPKCPRLCLHTTSHCRVLGPAWQLAGSVPVLWAELRDSGKSQHLEDTDLGMRRQDRRSGKGWSSPSLRCKSITDGNASITYLVS